MPEIDFHLIEREQRGESSEWITVGKRLHEFWSVVIPGWNDFRKEKKRLQEQSGTKDQWKC